MFTVRKCFFGGERVGVLAKKNFPREFFQIAKDIKKKVFYAGAFYSSPLVGGGEGERGFGKPPYLVNILGGNVSFVFFFSIAFRALVFFFLKKTRRWWWKDVEKWDFFFNR